MRLRSSMYRGVFFFHLSNFLVSESLDLAECAHCFSRYLLGSTQLYYRLTSHPPISCSVDASRPNPISRIRCVFDSSLFASLQSYLLLISPNQNGLLTVNHPPHLENQDSICALLLLRYVNFDLQSARNFILLNRISAFASYYFRLANFRDPLWTSRLLPASPNF